MKNKFILILCLLGLLSAGCSREETGRAITEPIWQDLAAENEARLVKLKTELRQYREMEDSLGLDEAGQARAAEIEAGIQELEAKKVELQGK